MKLKRLTAAVLALVMTAALLPAAMADAPDADFGGFLDAGSVQGGVMLLSAPAEAPLAASYHTWLFLNGEYLDASNIPDVRHDPEYLLPMRLICEADGGSADWYPEDNEAFFFFANQRIVVSFADNSVQLDFQPVEGVTATLVDGVTFLPASFVNSLEGVEVDDNPTMDVDRIDVKTPNGTPLMKLANELLEAAGLGMGMQTSPAELEEVYGEVFGFKAAYMTEGVAFLPMMISANTLVVGKLADGAESDLHACFDKYQAQQKEVFTTYLSHNLPAIENAKFATEGGWFLFVIAENADAAVELFHTRAAEMK